LRSKKDSGNLFNVVNRKAGGRQSVAQQKRDL